MRQTYHLEMQWPITDPETTAMEALRHQAIDDLEHVCHRHGLARHGGITFAFTHGAQPTLTAVLTVTGPVGLPRTITTHDERRAAA